MFVILTSCTTSNNWDYSLNDYIPQLVTLMATIIGWLLNYISTHMGRLIINVDGNKFYKSQSGQMTYFIKVYIYNNSIKPRQIRNFDIRFHKNNRLKLNSFPRYGLDEFVPTGILNNDKIDHISLNPYEAKSITLCNIIDKEDVQKLEDANIVIISYKKEKGEEKNIKIKDKFSFDLIELYTKTYHFD